MKAISEVAGSRGGTELQDAADEGKRRGGDAIIVLSQGSRYAASYSTSNFSGFASGNNFSGFGSGFSRAVTRGEASVIVIKWK